MTSQDNSTGTPPSGAALNAFLGSEPFWLGAAFVTGVLVVAATAMAALNALFSLQDQALADRVDVIYKLALIGVGVVTFCTIMWRGLIATRQANAQREQIEKLTRQIEGTERSDYAEMLQRGAELIDGSKPAQISAGIASLQAVAEGPSDAFGVAAMNVLADFLAQKGEQFADDLGIAAIAALESSFRKTGRWSSRTLRFSQESEYSDEIPTFQLVTGVFRTEYYQAYFESIELTPESVGITDFIFDDVHFSEGFLDLRCGRFFTCAFKSARILRYEPSRLGNVVFTNCDFSGCVMPPSGRVPLLREGMNYYSPDRPPVSAHGEEVDWERYLHKAKPLPAADQEED